MNLFFRKIFNNRVAYVVSIVLFYFSFNIIPPIIPSIGYPILILIFTLKIGNDFKKIPFLFNVQLLYKIVLIFIYIINSIVFYYLFIISFSSWHLWILALPITIFFLNKNQWDKLRYVYYIISFLNASIVLKNIELPVLAPLLLGISMLLLITDWAFKNSQILFEKIIPIIVLPLYVGMISFYVAPERPSSYDIGIRDGVRLIGPTANGDMYFRSFSWRATSRIIASDQHDQYLFIGDIFNILRINFSPPYNMIILTKGGRNEMVVDDITQSIYALNDNEKSIVKVNYHTLEKAANISVPSYDKSIFINIRITPDRQYIFALDEKSCLHRLMTAENSLRSLCTGQSHPSFGMDLQKRQILLVCVDGILIVNMDGMKPGNRMYVKNFSPKEISVDSTGRKFLLSDIYKEDAWLYDLDTWALLRTIHVGYGCRFQAFDPKHNIFYLLNYGQGDLLLIDPGSGKILADVGVGRRGRCLFLHPIKGTMRTSTSAGLVEVEPEKILKDRRGSPTDH